MVNYTALQHFNSVQTDEKRLSRLSVHDECYFFVFFFYTD